MNGRGNAFVDSIYIIVIIFVFGIVSIIGYSVFGDINSDFQSQDDFSNESKENLQELHDDYDVLFDGLVVTALVLLWIAAIIASFMIDSHPIFFVVIIVLLAFTVLLAGIMANAYEEVSTNEEFSNAADDFTMTNFVFNHYVKIIIVIAFSILLALYGKSRV